MFEIGDLVKLKSNGPVMTIESFNKGTKKCLCRWFAGDDVRAAEFSFLILVPVKPADPDETKTRRRSSS